MTAPAFVVFAGTCPKKSIDVRRPDEQRCGGGLAERPNPQQRRRFWEITGQLGTFQHVECVKSVSVMAGVSVGLRRRVVASSEARSPAGAGGAGGLHRASLSSERVIPLFDAISERDARGSRRLLPVAQCSSGAVVTWVTASRALRSTPRVGSRVGDRHPFAYARPAPGSHGAPTRIWAKRREGTSIGSPPAFVSPRYRRALAAESSPSSWRRERGTTVAQRCCARSSSPSAGATPRR